MFKHMLPATFSRAPAEAQGWIPRTWNLETEAAEVVWEFEQRRKKGQVRGDSSHDDAVTTTD